ncbi:response regulator transcription factor [Opitutus sp. ER46]|uniref:response regulator n=1 Tax=Opitutus sp. ER46 TaxID=2161864 RepID=UPI000D3112E7|nr:response regulator transcription factor [Opitutus sp. ER46]PTX90702.1 DNA-binding response regulator [Opitutus sp. ER46]
MAIRILLVDDHPMLRGSVTDCLLRQGSKFEVVGEAGSSEEALQKVAQLEPNLIIMDVEIPGENGIELTRRIRRLYPAVVVLILTAHGGIQRINNALDAGASGYLLKDCTAQELIAAVDATISGQVYLSPAASTAIVRDYQRQMKGEGNAGLTPREIDILRRITDGQTTKEIAYAMGLSTKTVETHRVNIMTKLDINTVAGLTKYAIREGLCRPE